MAVLTPSQAALKSAVQHYRAGKLDAAESFCKRAVAAQPGNADAVHLLGVIATERGNPARGVELIARAIAIRPNVADMHSNLGNAHLAAGEPDQAIACYHQALLLQPLHAAAHVNLSRACNDRGRHAAALASADRALAIDAALVEAHANRGFALRALGRLAEAEASFRSALQNRPGSAEVLTDLANVLADLDRFEEAVACHDRAVLAQPANVPARFARAVTMSRAGKIQEAERDLRDVLRRAPRFTDAWNALGRGLRAQGRFAEAAVAFRKTLRLRPGDAEALRNLALMRVTAEPVEARALQVMQADTSVPTRERIAAAFARGQRLDTDGDYEAAFSAYAAGNALQLASLVASGQAFAPQAFRSRIGALMAAPAPPSADQPASDLPVFILGMPRSGTSLVEQIAASHAAVFGAGELRAVGRIAASIDRGEDPGPLGAAHLETLRVLGGGKARVVDKMPDNVFHLGLIARLFPGARVVFCTRDARDTCLSCFCTLFASGNAFSYDLASCAVRHLGTERLAAHWRRTLPLRMMEMPYERLVADLEGEGRRLIAFLGLDWDPACLAFHATDRVVTTASAWQVRQRLYGHAVGRWRHYERWLSPLTSALASGWPD